MGSAGSVAGRGGDLWQQTVGNGSQGVEASHAQQGMEDAVRENLPWSLQEASKAMPLFSRQTPVIPLLQPGDMHFQNLAYVQNPFEHANNYSEQGIPTIIMWSHGGMSVFVAGSWDNWKTKVPLQRSGKEFAILKVLLPGFYHYKFIVDGEWRYAPDLPWMLDEMGNVLNILELQDYIPDNRQSIEDLETPESPDYSYSCCLDFSEDSKKGPPPAPPHMMDQPFIENGMSTFSKPSYVVLNHLYFQKPEIGHHVVAVGETCRFRSKYVMTVLFNSLKGL